MEKFFVLQKLFFSVKEEESSFLESIFSLLGIETNGKIIFVNRFPNNIEVSRAIVNSIASANCFENIKIIISFLKINNLISFEDELEIGTSILEKIGVSTERE